MAENEHPGDADAPSADAPSADRPSTDAPSPDAAGGAAADDAFPVEALLDALQHARVAELIVSTVSTLASVAYGKLEAREFSEARLAIDAVGVLLPLLGEAVEGDVVRDVDQALAALRLAYADAVAAAQ